jgi:leader peptidase (prepilin peptidase) / N-methyltransferase
MILFIPPTYWLAYGLCISALIVTIRTDFEKMLISRYLTWGLIPFAFFLSLFKLLPITTFESLLGALFGYTLLWGISKLFYYFRNIEGMGDGDMDLLAMIGAFIGVSGAWISLLLGSFFGVLASLSTICFKGQFLRKIAFGPWLAAGALVYIFFGKQIMALIFSLEH